MRTEFLTPEKENRADCSIVEAASLQEAGF